jgi:toxin CcdB
LRQFDVYRNPSDRSRLMAPFVVALQSHLLDAVPTILVAALLIDDGRSAYSGASVRIAFQGSDYILSVPEMAAADAALLREAVGSVAEHEDAIRRALDRVFTGF